MVPQFKRYVADINRTYSDGLYGRLPKVHLLHAQTWLLEAYNAAHDRAKSHQATVNILQTLGFEVDTDGGSIQKIIFTVESMLPREAMFLLRPLVGQAVEARQSGNTSIADHLLEFAAMLERVHYGTRTQTLKACQHRVSRALGVPATVIAEKMAELGF